MKIPDALKAALWTALFTFVALFGLSLVEWLQDVAAWAGDQTPSEFPSVSVLAKAAVAAVAAAVTGLVNWGVRAAQAATGRGTVPSYGDDGP